MALKLVDATQLDSDLTSVADAIRTAGGTSAPLTFPSDFVSAIGNISGGSADAHVVVAGGGNVFAPAGDPDHIDVFYDLTTPTQSATVNLTTRNSLWSTKGTHPAKFFDSQHTSPPFVDTGLYPIEIPSGSNSVNLTSTRSGQFDLFFIYYDGEWKQVSTTGWVNTGGSPITIPSGATHICVGLRVNTSNAVFNASNVLYDADLQFS